jgi:hypothetical protein
MDESWRNRFYSKLSVVLFKTCYTVIVKTSDEGKVNMKDVIYAALLGLIGGSILAVTYILRTGGF